MTSDRFLDINLDGYSVRARLRPDRAPKTCEAFWEALPMEGTAVHAIVSGQGFRMQERLSLPDLPLESGTPIRQPGELSYYPEKYELGFCAGESRFASYRGAQITPFAEIEGNNERWLKMGDDLQFTGAKPIVLSRAADQTTPFVYPTLTGTPAELEIGGVTATMVIPETLEEAIAELLVNELPITARISQSTWGLKTSRVWMSDSFRARFDALKDGSAGATTFHWSGYVYVHHGDGDIRICYGEAQEFHQGLPAFMTPVARLRGDFSELARQLQRLRTEGASSVQVRPA